MNSRDCKILIAHLRGLLSDRAAAAALGISEADLLPTVDQQARLGYRSARRELSAQGRELPVKPPAPGVRP